MAVAAPTIVYINYYSAVLAFISRETPPDTNVPAALAWRKTWGVFLSGVVRMSKQHCFIGLPEVVIDETNSELRWHHADRHAFLRVPLDPAKPMSYFGTIRGHEATIQGELTSSHERAIPFFEWLGAHCPLSPT